MPRHPGDRAYLMELARRLDDAPWESRGRLVAEAAGVLQVSVPTVYRRLTVQCGWHSGRKPRADKGATKLDERALQVACAMQQASIRDNGKRALPGTVVAGVVAANGLPLGASVDTFNRIRRARKLDRADEQAAPVSMRSLHPNHVHQVDPSLCLLYYVGGKAHIVRDSEHYKNKDALSGVRMKLWRYVLTDHMSGAVVPWYCEAAGETQENLFAFLMHAWGRQEGRPIHGVPRILIWDKGSANGAAGVRNLLDSLEVEPIAHARGNPRAKGQVECANNLVETQFESRLRFSDVTDAASLNLAAAQWAAAWNANLLPNQDTRITRNGQILGARYDLWLRITDEQLRLLPPIEDCRALMLGRPAERKVSARLQVSYRHPKAEQTHLYDVGGLDGICVGDLVTVQPLVFGDRAIRVTVPRYDGAPLHYRREPIALDAWGFPVDAPVWGQDQARQADTAAQRAGKDALRLAYPGKTLADAAKAKDSGDRPFAGQIDAVAPLADIQVPDYLQRRGRAIEIPAAAQVEIRTLTHTQAALRLRGLMGDSWNADTYARMVEWHPEGVPEDGLQALSERLQRAPVGLKAVS